MFYNLKISLRNLRSGGMYSVINITGLAIGLAACILILFWVQDELSFDRFHHRSEDIFLTNTCFEGDNKSYWNVACAPLAFTAKEEIPEIENVCRFYAYWGVDMLKYYTGIKEETVTGFTCGMVDTTFFSIFNFPILEGDAHNMLTDPNAVVVSESIARQLFGGESAVGKTLQDKQQNSYHITGVIADMPLNSSFRFDILLPFALYESSSPNELTSWSRFDFKTWFLLRPHTDMKVVAQKLTEIQHRNTQKTNISYDLQAIRTINLYNADGTANTKAQSCRLFVIIAFMLILIAGINYVNLTTAKASRRNKEIFVKNILGATRKKLFFQFFNESVWLFLCSLFVAICLLYLVFPIYNQVTGKQLVFHLFSVDTMIVYGLTFLIVVLIAGIYPAINLSLRKPLQGINSTGSNISLRRILVVGQFMVAIILVATTITLNRQLEFIKEKDLGYEKENIFHVSIPSGMKKHIDAVKSELRQSTAISGITAISQTLSKVTSTYTAKVEGDEEGTKIVLLNTDKDFIATMNVTLVAGNDFSGTPADDTHFILNETAVREMSITDPIGKQVFVNRVTGIIIGVVKDFNFDDLHSAIKPMVIYPNDRRNVMYVKTTGNDASRAIAAVEKVWKAYEANLPFSYHFIDDEFDQVYKTDLRMGILFQCFAIIAIFVSCLGLFGLVTYTADTKTKEIGIRKVLGASVISIVKLLSKEFLLLVGIAIFIAFPLAWWLLNRMLQDYAYRIEISWWMFAVTVLITILFTILTVGVQSVKAATANPVKSIKTE